jgi:hypothetical protein
MYSYAYCAAGEKKKSCIRMHSMDTNISHPALSSNLHLSPKIHDDTLPTHRPTINHHLPGRDLPRPDDKHTSVIPYTGGAAVLMKIITNTTNDTSVPIDTSGA